jgi:hypothetical protein
MSVENLSRYYGIMTKDTLGEVWRFAAGLGDDDGQACVFVYGQASVEGAPWQLVSVAAIDPGLVLGQEDVLDQALVCSIASQVFEDLAALSEEDDAPHNLKLMGTENLRDVAGHIRINVSELLESRGPQAQLTALEEAIWNILAGATID